MSRSWWGRAWVDAVEAIAGERGARLGRGRTLAKRRAVTDLQLSPGGANAWVDDGGPEPQEVFVGIRELRDDEWDAVLDAIAAKAAHAAALLDGELDPGVVDDAADVEVDLLPKPRDLRTVCTCPDDAEPCAHAAAVCHVLADALDDDPFVLLLLRGRGRDDVLDGVRSRRSPAARATGAGDGDGADGGLVLDLDLPAATARSATEPVDPAEAWRREPGELPHVPLPAHGPSRPAAWPSDPPSRAPFDGHGLRALVTDAARRAWELSVGNPDTGLDLPERADVARRAVGASPMQRDQIAVRTGIAAVELEVLAAAWESAGAEGVRATDEPRWNPPPLDMARARDLLVEVGMEARRVHVSGNRVTAEGRVQFRRSRDGRWYVFAKDTGRWAMAGPPSDDIEDLLDIV